MKKRLALSRDTLRRLDGPKLGHAAAAGTQTMCDQHTCSAVGCSDTTGGAPANNTMMTDPNG
jgi:hypothetical protein